MAAVGAFDQTKVRWSVAAVCAGMPTAQEMIRSYDNESHEVLHEVADEFGVALPGESVHAVVRAGIQHAVGIHAHGEVADEFGVALPGESVHAVVRAGIQHAVGIHAHGVDVRKTAGVGSARGAVST
ncbi:hypothetical protein H7I77_07575 [Mycolicibacterium novocastrense]|uniref:Uncharacterized protein n=1 Tax=Mycolicibacterium novocastrense TaxID=59813 RepID=A0AAW5SIJ4_MYCNV|nr:hypothetical protein [Mycolicibacterium novocastrense]MCV7023211.1 hypothetical protein [Mycolicibacterium novocastrense]